MLANCLLGFSDDDQCFVFCLTMPLDIMFLTNDNLRRMRKEPQVLGLRYRVCQWHRRRRCDLSHVKQLSITTCALKFVWKMEVEMLN